MARWTKKHTAEARKVLVEGYSDKQAAEELGFSIDDWMDLRAMTESEEGAAEDGKSDEAVFGGFKLRQQARLRALERMNEGDRAPTTAEVSSVRAGAEIDLQTLKVGQDIGIYRREPERQEVGVAARVGAMGDCELQEWLEADRREFYRLYEGRGGGVPLLAIRGERWGRNSAELAGAASGGEDGQGS